MAICKFCLKAFSWGQKDDGRFVPLVPIEDDAGMDRTYQDEDGVLRAEHWLVCVRRGGRTVRVSKLAKPIAANEVLDIRKQPKEHIDPDTGEITAVYE